MILVNKYKLGDGGLFYGEHPYTCIHTHVRTYNKMHKCMHVYMHMATYAYIRIHIHTSMETSYSRHCILVLPVMLFRSISILVLHGHRMEFLELSLIDYAHNAVL